MDTSTVLFVCLFATICYFLPWLAAGRNHPQRAGIFVLNLFLGWTFIGWVVALIWAVCSSSKPAAGASL